jgi:hypothetical protein
LIKQGHKLTGPVTVRREIDWVDNLPQFEQPFPDFSLFPVCKVSCHQVQSAISRKAAFHAVFPHIGVVLKIRLVR